MTTTGNLKAVFLNGTLKSKGEVSHTEILSEFLATKLKAYNVESEIIHLAEKSIALGVQSDMGAGDEWPAILEKLFTADIIILATPIWWGSYSSLTQKVIERMDSVRGEEFATTGKSPFNNKVGGVVITGAQDGAEQIIGHLAMIMSWIGLTVPPACSVSILAGINYSLNDRAQLLEQYEKDYGAIAQVTAANLAAQAKLLKEHPIYPVIQ